MQIPRFRCKIFLHLIPEPEEKASELLRDLTANDSCDRGRQACGAYSGRGRYACHHLRCRRIALVKLHPAKKTGAPDWFIGAFDKGSAIFLPSEINRPATPQRSLQRACLACGTTRETPPGTPSAPHAVDATNTSNLPYRRARAAAQPFWSLCHRKLAKTARTTTDRSSFPK